LKLRKENLAGCMLTIIFTITGFALLFTINEELTRLGLGIVCFITVFFLIFEMEIKKLKKRYRKSVKNNF